MTEVGLKPTVVPAGCPLALRLTDCAEPLVTAVPIVEAPLPPCATETELGLALMEKSDWVTVSETVVVCEPLAAVPVTVTVYVPGAAVPAFTVIVDELPAVTDVGLKLTVEPTGWPLALRLIVCAEPLVTAVEIVDVPLAPCASESVLGLELSEKSDGTVLQLANLNVPTRVCQLNAPFAASYSSVYQKVQSSDGSTLMLV